MKSLKMASVLLAGALLGLATDAWRVSRQNAERARELATLRDSLHQARAARERTVIERDQLKIEADRLRQWAEDVHRLRAEVARLKGEAAQNQAAQAQKSRAERQTEAEGDKARESAKARKDGRIPIESAPPVIQATVLREFGNAFTNNALGRFSDDKGRTTYGFKGQLTDGRLAALVMGEDGSVLHRSVDIAADTVPAQIQTAAARFFGDLAISGAREVLEEGNLRYELTGKGPNGGMQMTVGGDGTIVSYSAKFLPPPK